MYSDDLRKAAKTAYICLQSYRKVALCFGLAHSTVWRWLRTMKKDNNLQKPHGEWIRCAMVIAFIRQVVQDTPFVTRIELRKRINLVFQFTPSLKLVSNALKHAGISKVKCRTRCVGKSPATQIDHETFSCLWGQGDAVAIDECGFQTQHAPLKGYTKKGSRLYHHSSSTSRKWITATVAVSSKVGHISSFQANSQTGNGFASFITFLPFPPGTTIVMDNASIHKTSAVKAALEAKKYNPKYIPAYSPDFNPIENVFGVVKTAWRRINATRNSCWSDAPRVIRSLFDTKATPGTIRRHFQHTARLLKQQVVSKQFPETSSMRI